MYERHETGREGEEIATNYLKQKEYIILQRNFQCNQGEIDIIAKDKQEYVFIEVKTRKNFHYGMPAEAVTEKKQKHIVNATKYYMYINRLENQYIRFDVIEIYQVKGQYKINHLKQIR